MKCEQCENYTEYCDCSSVPLKIQAQAKELGLRSEMLELEDRLNKKLDRIIKILETSKVSL